MLWHIWKKVWQYLKMLNMSLFYPTILLIGIYPRKVNRCPQKDLFMFTAILEELKCPMNNE